MTTTIAFSNAARRHDVARLDVLLEQTRMAAPARQHSSILPGSSAGIDELYGSDMPSASMAEAIVLAVYMPPQAPAPGQLLAHDLLPACSRRSCRPVLAVALKRRDDVELFVPPL